MEITYELIKNAYDAIGIVPQHGEWIDVSEDSCAACGMTALYTHMKVNEIENLSVKDILDNLNSDWDHIGEEITSYLIDKGFNRVSISGFIHGFDGQYNTEKEVCDDYFIFVSVDDNFKDNYLKGWRVGSQLYKELFDKVEEEENV